MTSPTAERLNMEEDSKRARAPQGDQRRILSPDALDIVQGRKPWPRELHRWKLGRELLGFDNPWQDEAYMTPAQIAHERAESRAWRKYEKLVLAGKLHGETGDEFDARLQRDAPWPYPPYEASAEEIRRHDARARARRAMAGRA